MRGCVPQAEVVDGAVVLDEARVRGAAGGAELRGAAGDRGDGIGKQRAPRARRTEEGPARNPESEVVAGAAAAVDRTVASLADPGLNGAAGLDIVEEHVAPSRRLGGDHLARGAAGVARRKPQAGRRAVRSSAA